jgi:hypothetical protein
MTQEAKGGDSYSCNSVVAIIDAVFSRLTVSEQSKPIMSLCFTSGGLRWEHRIMS